MGIWHFIRPEGTINYARNPTFENNITDWWNNYATGAAGGARAQSDGPLSKFGAHALFLQKNAGANNDRWGLSGLLNITSVLNQTYIASCWVRTTSTATINILILKGAGVGIAQEVTGSTTGPTTTTAEEWTRIETPVLTANATGDALTVYVYLTGAATATGTYIDAVQLELKSAATTYCDGDQPGCEWLEAPNLGHSQRSDVSRAGGYVVDFADMDFDIQGMIGPGMTPISLNVDSYAILPGGELNSQKTQVRPFSLTGWIKGTSLANLHANRQAIIDDLKPNAVPGDQPVILRYTGAVITKEINAYYEAGLEGRIRADFECLEQNVALRFLATDPDFTEIGESADILDSNDTNANGQNVAGRLRSTGQWDVLGPPAAAGGPYGLIHAIVVGPDNDVFYGGTFTNFNNIAAADNIVAYTPATSTWSALVVLNNTVNGLAFGPDGTLYAVGQFLNASGVANADYIAAWDGVAWSAVGNPNQGAAVITSILDLAFDSTGNLYVTGNFLNLANIANADYVAMWDGAAWNAVGIPNAGAAVITQCDPIAIDSQDNVYVGGTFTSFANIAGADYIAMWDGTNWNLVVQLNGITTAFAMASDDTLYLGGVFTDAGGETDADGIASWNGISISSLSTGLNTGPACLAFGPDGLLYAAGTFNIAGGLTVPGAATWNGASWAHLDFTLSGSLMQQIEPGPADPVVAENYDLWVGFDSGNSTLDYAGLVTVDNEGTEEAFPRINVRRSGGTSATLYSIRNETTGKVLLFAYSLLDGEELTIDLAPTQKSIVSSFFGPRPDAILANCDFGEWALQPGENEVSCFVDIAGAPTIEVEIIWPDSYWSAD